MKSTSCKAGGFVLPLLLGMMFLVVGCSQTLSTQIGEIDRSIAAGVCKAFPAITYSSRDTERTQLEVRAHNAARVAYGCEG